MGMSLPKQWLNNAQGPLEKVAAIQKLALEDHLVNVNKMQFIH